MNCIYCNVIPATTRKQGKILEYKCHLCHTEYIVDGNDIDIFVLHVAWSIDDKNYQAEIWPQNKDMNILLNDEFVFKNLPLEWMFPHILPDRIKRLHEIRAFL